MTISRELMDVIHEKGYRQQTIAPVIGLTAANFSHRKNGHVSWELDKVFALMEFLGLPLCDIPKYFCGTILTKKKHKPTAIKNRRTA